jgi:hypothetical protein
MMSLQIRRARLSWSNNQFGILLALFPLMRKFVATVLFISLTAIPYVTVTQKNSTENTDTQRRAKQIADRFVERFQQTLDFGVFCTLILVTYFDKAFQVPGHRSVR